MWKVGQYLVKLSLYFTKCFERFGGRYEKHSFVDDGTVLLHKRLCGELYQRLFVREEAFGVLGLVCKGVFERGEADGIDRGNSQSRRRADRAAGIVINFELVVRI
jgi:hypothetical protein